jgi:hypothetical protein
MKKLALQCVVFMVTISTLMTCLWALLNTHSALVRLVASIVLLWPAVGYAILVNILKIELPKDNKGIWWLLVWPWFIGKRI